MVAGSAFVAGTRPGQARLGVTHAASLRLDHGRAAHRREGLQPEVTVHAPAERGIEPAQGNHGEDQGPGGSMAKGLTAAERHGR